MSCKLRILVADNHGIMRDGLLVDFSRSPTIGTDSIASLKREWPELRILVPTFHGENCLIEAALCAGADGIC